jgi:glycosyltransferase involved in cell wall biosynthesis
MGDINHISKEILLTIAIPTYNRGNTLYRNLLIHSDGLKDFTSVEILVNDNNSPDKTEELVKKIIDPKIQYYKNTKNIGYDANLIECIKRARGKFIFFCSDEDLIEYKNIPWILQQIKQHKNLSQIVGTLYDVNLDPPQVVHYNLVKDHKFLSKGEESLMKILFRIRYLSGRVLKISSLDVEQPVKHIGTVYLNVYFMGQAMVNGDTLCTKRVMAITGKELKGDMGTYWTSTKRISFLNFQLDMLSELLGDNLLLINKILKREMRWNCQTLVDSYINNNPTIFESIWLFLKDIPVFFRDIKKFAYNVKFWKENIREFLICLPKNPKTIFKQISKIVRR